MSATTEKPLPPGAERRPDGTLRGWTGRNCPRCKGTGEDFSDANAPHVSCRACGGTGEEYGVITPATKS